MRRIERNNETREKRDARKRGREMTEIKGKIFSKQQGGHIPEGAQRQAASCNELD